MAHFEELRELLKERFSRRPNKNVLEMRRVATSIELEEMLEEHLVDPLTSLVFEVKPSNLSELQEVIEFPSIRNKYEITQQTSVLFVARMQSVEL